MNIQEQLQAVLDRVSQLSAQVNPGGGGAPGAAGPVPGNPAIPGFFRPPTAMGTVPQPLGWSVSIDVPAMGPNGPGTVAVDLAFGAESWPQAQSIIETLIMQGLPIRVRQPYNNNGNGGGFRGNGGGFGGGGGNWGNRGGGGNWNGGGNNWGNRGGGGWNGGGGRY